MSHAPFPDTFEEYHLLLLTLAWVTGFGVGLRRGWAWPRSVGLALVAYPFWRMAVGVWLTAGHLFDGGVARPLELAEIWEKIFWHAFWYLAVPGLGLLLVYERVPALARDGPRWGISRDNGLAARASHGDDALAGASLFFGIAFAYVLALALVTSALGDVVNTGDDSRVFDNITPLTVLLLSIVAGVTEEFLFRGVLQTHLGRGLGRWFAPRLAVGLAIFLQAAFFGLVHSGYGNVAHVIGPFLFGLGMGVVTRRLGIAAAVVLHAEIDVLALGLAGFSLPVLFLFGALVAANVYGLLVLRAGPLRDLLATGRVRPDGGRRPLM